MSLKLTDIRCWATDLIKDLIKDFIGFYPIKKMKTTDPINSVSI